MTSRGISWELFTIKNTGERKRLQGDAVRPEGKAAIHRKWPLKFWSGRYGRTRNERPTTGSMEAWVPGHLHAHGWAPLTEHENPGGNILSSPGDPEQSPLDSLDAFQPARWGRGFLGRNVDKDPHQSWSSQHKALCIFHRKRTFQSPDI